MKAARGVSCHIDDRRRDWVWSCLAFHRQIDDRDCHHAPDACYPRYGPFPFSERCYLVSAYTDLLSSLGGYPSFRNFRFSATLSLLLREL